MVGMAFICAAMFELLISRVNVCKTREGRKIREMLFQIVTDTNVQTTKTEINK